MSCDTYYEPFIGGGSIYFALANETRFNKAVIGDWNHELVNVYRIIQGNVEDLIIGLKKVKQEYQNDQKAAFFKHRAINPMSISDLDMAIRTLFLNATSFSHKYSVNMLGKYNAAYADADFSSMICKEDLLRKCSEVLNKNTTIVHYDFSKTVAAAEKDDFVYLDPPYVPLNSSSKFTGYRAGGFGIDEQRRVFGTFETLAARGAAVMMSNSNSPIIHEWYKDYKIRLIPVQRRVNCHRGEPRQNINETLVTANLG